MRLIWVFVVVSRRLGYPPCIYCPVIFLFTFEAKKNSRMSSYDKTDFTFFTMSNWHALERDFRIQLIVCLHWHLKVGCVLKSISKSFEMIVFNREDQCLLMTEIIRLKKASFRTFNGLFAYTYKRNSELEAGFCNQFYFCFLCNRIFSKPNPIYKQD